VRIAVITAFRAGEVISFLREAALVKSASLYADAVEVLSFSSLVYTDWGAIPPEQAEQLRNAFIHPDATGDLPAFTTSSDRVSTESGVNELLPAVREGLLAINDRIPREGDVWGAFIDEIVRYLNDPTYVVLLDDFLGGIAAAAVRDGRANLSSAAHSASVEAVIGAGLIARLPAFTEIPMGEVLDLRRDLNSPLVRYRAAVSAMRADDLDPHSSSREAAIDFLWRQKVAPALLELEEQLKDHGLVKELARSLGADIRSVVTGAPLRASLALGAGTALQMDAVAGAVAAGVAAFAPPVIDGFNARGKARRSVQRSDFYYLYRLNTRPK
jgi:hypothetical protein